MVKKTTTKKATTAATTAAGFKPTVKKILVLPLLKKVDEVPLYVEITGAIFKGSQTITATESKTKKQMEPADLANVRNLETGDVAQIIVNSVLKSTLEENYPDQSYVGCWFEIIQHQVEGKRYKTYTVNELEKS